MKITVVDEGFFHESGEAGATAALPVERSHQAQRDGLHEHDSELRGGGLGVVFLGVLLGIAGAVMMVVLGAGILKAVLMYSLGGTLASLCVAVAAFFLSVGDSDL
jgi:hypothetical protein